MVNLENLFVFADAFGSFFAEEEYSWAEAEDYSDSEKYNLEQSIIGVGISPHPLVKISKEARKDYVNLSDLVEGQKATVLVQIQSIRTIRTKKTGEQMAFLQVTDTKKKLDVTLFPEVYRRYASELKEGQIFYLSGRIQERDGHLQLLLENMEAPNLEKFWILLENKKQDKEVAAILKNYPGVIPVVLNYQDSNQTIQAQGIFVKKTAELQEKLQGISLKTVFR